MYHSKELMIDKSVNKKCLERVQGLLSQFTVSDVRNCLNYLSKDSRWLEEHIAIHDFVKENNKVVLDCLVGPEGRTR